MVITALAKRPSGSCGGFASHEIVYLKIGKSLVISEVRVL